MPVNDDIRFFHAIDREAAERMAEGQRQHGIFDPNTNDEDLGENGLEEAADSVNYSTMESQVILTIANLDHHERQALLDKLAAIRGSSRTLGALWAEYIEVKRRMLNQAEPKAEAPGLAERIRATGVNLAEVKPCPPASASPSSSPTPWRF